MNGFDYTTLAAQISDESSRIVSLSAASFSILLDCLCAMEKRYHWHDGLSEVSDLQWDDIENWVANAAFEIQVPYSTGDNGLETGMIVPFATSSTPNGLLLCDGSQYARVAYPDLYAVIDSAFIVDADNFTVPDLGNRFIYGYGDSGNVGDTGGAEEHTLTVSEMPAHSHGISSTAKNSAAGTDRRLPNANDDYQSTTVGGGSAHNNMPPYLRLSYGIVT